MRKSVTATILLFWFLSAPLQLFAQDTPPNTLTSCFDHYKFGNPSTTIVSSLSQAAQGGTIEFSGNVRNASPEVLANLDIWLKVVRTDTASSAPARSIAGLVKAKENIRLDSGQTSEWRYSFAVPKDMPTGTYTVYTYVTSHGRFSHSGVLTSSEVTGPFTTFAVVGDKAGGIYFNANTLLINGTHAKTNDFPVTVAKDAPAVISVPITNTSNEPYKGNITWRVYNRDALDERNLLVTETQELKVHPHASADGMFTVKDTTHADYFVVGDIETAGRSHTYVEVRFIREGYSDAHVVYAGFDKGTPYVCVSPELLTPPPDTEVSLTVRPSSLLGRFVSLFNKNTYAEEHYSGPLPATYGALVAKITAPSDAYTLTATIKQNGKLKDSVMLSYACEDIHACPTPTIRLLTILIPGLLILCILVAIRFMYKKKTVPTDMYQIKQ